MLNTIRVLDLTQYLSGPSSTQMLAHLGADVIKVEFGPAGDPTRSLPGLRNDRSGFFVQQNRGKRSICVDFADPRSHELIAELAGECDVMVENFSAGVLERRGLDYVALSKRYPKLIVASISAFGRTGSLAHLPGYDIIGQAYSGVMAVTGEPDGFPQAAGVGIADCSAGAFAFGAIGHALFARTLTGEGQHIDVSLVESLFTMQALAVQRPSVEGLDHRQVRSGRLHGAVAPTGCYRSPDGFIAIQVLAPQWDRLCEAAASVGLGDDARFTTSELRAENREVLAEVLEAWMLTFATDEELLKTLEEHRCPASPIVDPAEAGNYPWFRERGALRDITDPFIGEMTVPGFPMHFSGHGEPGDESPAPTLGEHSRDVLTDVLGYDEAQIDRLFAAGTVSAPALP
ncbi:MAG: CoA:oxalate CoA-transferase [Acidimicrobiales bacterium]|jgi:CoA:oxalate CoA-transferase